MPTSKPKATRRIALDSAAKRLTLPVRGKPYFVPAGEARDGASLGYRRRKGGAGTWVARLKMGATPYEHALGQAADTDTPPPGALDFSTARARALEWCRARREALLNAIPGDGTSGAAVPTVAAVAARYLDTLGAAATARGTGAASAQDTAAVLAKHLLGGGRARHPSKPLAAKALDKITRADLQGWLRGLDAALSPGSVARVVNTMRALLRGAWSRAGHAAPAGWDALIKDGLNTKSAGRSATNAARHVEEVRQDFLTDADVVRLLDACRQVGPDLHRLATVLAATGLRFSQLVRMRVRDVDMANAVLLVPTSAKGDTLTKEQSGKPAFVRVHIAPDVLDTLRPAVNGRRGDEILLMRDHHAQPRGSAREGRGDWREDARGRRVWIAERVTERRPWGNTAQIARAWKQALALAGLPPTVSTYHLRDWSIIRLLRTGLDPVTVARRHDTSVAMIEASYGRHILSAQEAALRAAAPVLSAATPTRLRAVGAE
jgi:integrase